MPQLATCSHCHAFLPDASSAACPHCQTPPAPHRLRRALFGLLLAPVATVTLMACYGAPFEPCSSDEQCGAGATCNINTGYCEYPDGYCFHDGDCPAEYSCNLEQNRCELPPLPECGVGTASQGCSEGSECSSDGVCTPCEDGTCVGQCPIDEDPLPPDPSDPSPGDAEASDAGVPEADAGADQDAPSTEGYSCPDGSVAVVIDGVETGECLPLDACEARACEALDEDSCAVSDTCQPIYKGINCTDEQGQGCTSTSTDCSCESFVFDACVVAPSEAPQEL